MTIRIGSRGSELALTQSRWVGKRLQSLSDKKFVIEAISTKGDLDLDSPLPEIGGKGLFTADLENALRAGQIDLAVHSLKDLPVETPGELVIGAIPKREAPQDQFIYDPAIHDPEAGSLPVKSGCRVGSSSLRRRGALLNIRPDLVFTDLRGNVPTRIEKLRRGEYDAIVLAAAGINRLGLELEDFGVQNLPVDRFPPAPAQGALGIQCRASDAKTRAILGKIHDPISALCAKAERRVLQKLGGGCSMPLGALIQLDRKEGYRMHVGLFADSGPGAAIFRSLHGKDPLALADQIAEALMPFIGRPLESTSIVLLRPGGEGGELAAALRVAGACVTTHAMTEIRPVHPSRDAWQEMPANPILAFSSPRAVDRLFEAASTAKIDLAGARCFAGGRATAAAIIARGFDCVAPQDGHGGGSALAQLLLGSDVDQSQPIHFPCARDRHGSFEKAMLAAGMNVHPLILYETHELAEARPKISREDIVVFSSPSAVKAFARTQNTEQTRAVAIGPTTAKAMADARIANLETASTPTPAALLKVLKDIQDA